MMRLLSTIFENLKYLVFFVLMICGGLSKESVILPVIILFLLSTVLFWKYQTTKITIPVTFNLFLIFMVLFLVSNFWSRDFVVSYKIYLTFLAGGAIWLYFANIKISEPFFGRFLVTLAFIFSFMFLYLKLTSGTYPPGYNMFWYPSRLSDHNHLGDLWAAALLFPVYELFIMKRNNFLLSITLIFGFILLGISFSRSGYLSFAIGTLYLFYSYGWNKYYKKVYQYSVIILVGLFLLVGTQKTLLGSRQYWLQSIAGLFKEPLGVGVGNFGLISEDPSNHIFGASSFSNVVHNIVLEFISGLGVLGLSFLIWIVNIAKVLFRTNDKNVLAKSIFLALTINFMFDFTYFIPVMLWLWFIALGIITNHFS